MKTVIITTADNITEDTYNRIVNGFKQRFGEETEFIHIKDNSVIGGFTADADGEIFDLSIRSQLLRLKKQITV